MIAPASVSSDERLRLFLALRLPDDVLDEVERWQRGQLPGVRLVRREHLHVTLAFLGHRPVGELDSIVDDLRGAAAEAGEIRLTVARYRETRSVGMLALEDDGGSAAALADDLQERLEPALVGWQGHAQPFEFEPELERAPGIGRFLTGTPNVPALYAATAGYDVIEEVGVGRIRENSLRQTALLIGLLEEAGLEVGSPRDPARRGGTVTVKVPDPAAAHAELGAQEILCDFRPDVGLRLGPHFYNSDEELRFTVRELTEIVETGAYERHLGAAARF